MVDGDLTGRDLELAKLDERLSYFLITASVALLVFTANFFSDRYGNEKGELVIRSFDQGVMIATAASAAICAVLTLVILAAEHAAYRGQDNNKKAQDKYKKLRAAVFRWASRLRWIIIAAFLVEVVCASIVFGNAFFVK